MSEKAKNLILAAQDDGILSNDTAQALVVADIGAQIQAGLGVDVDDVDASEVLLVTMMPDDSGSIFYGGNKDLVIDGHNMVLDDVLADTKQEEGILAMTRYLNGHVYFPYTPIAQAVKMDSSFDCGGGTPLFDNTVLLLATIVAKAQEFADNGVPVRTITLLITDGDDQHSRRFRSRDVAKIIRDMLRTEDHIIAAMGIDDGETDFRKVFREMGIEDKWILTPKDDPGEIRKAFQLFSRSAVRASQGAANFSQATLGGFGT